MDKKILEDYIDACEYAREIREEIARMKQKRRIVQDKVYGSNPDWPYEARSFQVSGTTDTPEDASLLDRKEALLARKLQEAEELKLGVEEWMQDIPFRMQRIIRYKIFKDLTWEETAVLMGRKCTAEGIKKEFQRFMQKI